MHAAIGYAAPANGVNRCSIAEGLNRRTDETMRRKMPSAIPTCVSYSGFGGHAVFSSAAVFVAGELWDVRAANAC